MNLLQEIEQALDGLYNLIHNRVQNAAGIAAGKGKVEPLKAALTAHAQANPDTAAHVTEIKRKIDVLANTAAAAVPPESGDVTHAIGIPAAVAAAPAPVPAAAAPVVVAPPAGDPPAPVSPAAVKTDAPTPAPAAEAAPAASETAPAEQSSSSAAEHPAQ